MSGEERRLAALTTWAAWSSAQGHEVPAPSVLAAVAATGSVDPGADAVAAGWAPTIEHLLHQLKFGVKDPHLQLEDRLTRPTAAAPTPAVSASPPPFAPPAEDSLLAHLRADPRVRAIAGLKDVHLKMVVKSGRRTASEIGSFLPVDPAREAGVIANSIAAFRGDVRVPDAAAAAAPPAAAARPAASAPPQAQAPPQAAVPAARPQAQAQAQTQAQAPEPVSPADEAVSPGGFAPYEYGDGSDEVLDVVITRDDEGRIVVEWPARGAGAVYRLVAEDAAAPYSPDESRLVVATTGATATDGEPAEHAVRHYQVWRNDGPSPESAKRSQPVLHAAGVLVLPVADVELRPEAGQVVGRWRALPGTSAVHVYRVPKRFAAQGGDARYRIGAESKHLTGIVDESPVGGESYLYRVVAEADVDGTPRLSKPFTALLTPPVRLDPVADLRISAIDDGFVDLMWSAPLTGRVVVYRSQEPPAAGIDREPVSEALLAQQGALAAGDRLAHPVEQGEDGTQSMVRVSWPSGWTRAFFTPVVIAGGRALVGTTTQRANVPPVGRPTLIERVQRQLLTFDWPNGADVVQVYRSESGGSAADAMHGSPLEIAREDYRDRGGFDLRDLPAKGCDLHLVSVLFDEGARVQSAPVTVHYGGILRLRYTCAVKRPLFGQKGVVVSITSEFVPTRPPVFVLVHNPDRLPLSKLDGTRLAMVEDGDAPGAPSVAFRPASLGRPEDADRAWRTDEQAWKRIASAPGWVRLFVEVEPAAAARIALLDPPIASLALKAGQRG